MSTPNFHFKNRCIYVSPDDLENENHPDTTNEESPIALHSYGSWLLADQPTGCTILKAIMTAGYYEGACLDYVPVVPDGFDADDADMATIIEEEKPIMNLFLDNLIDLYGLMELSCVGIFSNGEAIYEPKK